MWPPVPSRLYTRICSTVNFKSFFCLTFFWTIILTPMQNISVIWTVQFVVHLLCCVRWIHYIWLRKTCGDRSTIDYIKISSVITNRNGQQILNSDNVRIVVYPAQPVNNQMLASIEIREVNVGQNQNQPLRLNRRRLSVQLRHLNYSRIHCIFCNRLVTTNDESAICDRCLVNNRL